MCYNSIREFNAKPVAQQSLAKHVRQIGQSEIADHPQESNRLLRVQFRFRSGKETLNKPNL